MSDAAMRAKRVPMRLGDLEDLRLPDRGDPPEKLAAVRGMDDERLLESINNPDELGGSVVLNNDGGVLNGNHRIGEALDRMHDPYSPGITPDTEVWVVP
ncbi:hypothetical protein SAZ11_35670 [Streptomyces sp. FXJ1.4098]|nr:hypothetical protein [Streptomyces sp. FXJ1.4098]